MSVIQVLPLELKNKIAAGEVVERPASVVKELLENSIDAGSTRIEVAVERGGRKLIRVSDDGEGMDAEDARLALQRHATSKLLSERDLFSITTMGFRGEALPSMASVSRMTLLSAPRGESLGVRIALEGGEVTEDTAAAARGTTVEVRDLFFNTPARKKFLKRESTELMHIVDTVTNLALSHPETAWTLTVDSEESMRLPRASGPRERIAQVYGSEFLEGLVEGSLENDGFALTALVSAPGNYRERRTHQLLFINRRPVRNPSVSHAVYSAYEGILPRDKHPVFFLFLSVEPSRVDFNVHPAKREAKFADGETVYRSVRRCVSETVRMTPVPGATEAVASGSPRSFYPRDVPFPPQGAAAAATHGIAEALELDYRAEVPHVYLGETFVALARDGGLMLLDHHAAHERVLYEKFLRGIELESRRLLFPRQVQLSRKEHMLILENREFLHGFGLEVDDFGRDTVIVRALPAALEQADLRGILSDAAGALQEGERPGKSLREAVAARLACHSSVRGRTVLTKESLQALLSDLSRAEDPEHCPHGRPTRLFYSLDELKKLFKRM
jgi:DNA mismatch repair protein MutL